MKTAAYSLFALLIIASACNKDQGTNNKIDGSWRVLSVNDIDTGFGWFNNDSLISLNEIQSFEFYACEQKDNDCNGSLTGTTSDTTVGQLIGLSYDFTYNISGKGGSLNMWIKTSADSAATPQELIATMSDLKDGTMTLEANGSTLKLEQTFER